MIDGSEDEEFFGWLLKQMAPTLAKEAAKKKDDLQQKNKQVAPKQPESINQNVDKPGDTSPSAFGRLSSAQFRQPPSPTNQSNDAVTEQQHTQANRFA